MAINISNAKKREAGEALGGLAPRREVRFVDTNGNPVRTQKLLKTDLAYDLPQLIKKRKKLETVGKALVNENNEKNI